MHPNSFFSEGICVCASLYLPWQRAREALLACYESHRVDGHCLGWLPRSAYNARHQEGQIYTCHNNGDHVGHCMWQSHDQIAKIYMTWVRPDARLILHGRALVNAIEKTAALRGCKILSLWCAEDLAANYFWRALGFLNPSWRWGRGHTPRKHLLWRRPILAQAIDWQSQGGELLKTSLATSPPPPRIELVTANGKA